MGKEFKNMTGIRVMHELMVDPEFSSVVPESSLEEEPAQVQAWAAGRHVSLCGNLVTYHSKMTFLPSFQSRRPNPSCRILAFDCDEFV